jgi:Ca2+-binding RTX toxin-like protein
VGNKANKVIASVFLGLAMILGFIAILGTFVYFDSLSESDNPVFLVGGIIIYLVTGVFGFLSYFYYKKVAAYENKSKTPQQRNAEKKKTLETLAVAGIIGGIVAVSGIALSSTNLVCGGESDFVTIHGTEGNDVLTGTSHKDVIHGLGGDDTIHGMGGNDIICGGPGDDEIIGGDGNDEIWASEGNDFIEGGSGDDDLRGEDGNDQIFGGVGNDFVFGGDGDDIVKGGWGDDLVWGSDGDDVLDGGDGNDKLSDIWGINEFDGGEGIDECSGNEDSILTSCEKD